MVSEAVLPCAGRTWSLPGRSLGHLPTLCAFTNHHPGAQAAKVSFQRETNPVGKYVIEDLCIITTDEIAIEYFCFSHQKVSYSGKLVGLPNP